MTRLAPRTEPRRDYAPAVVIGLWTAAITRKLAKDYGLPAPPIELCERLFAEGWDTASATFFVASEMQRSAK